MLGPSPTLSVVHARIFSSFYQHQPLARPRFSPRSQARACAIISIIVHVGALLAGGGWFFFGLYQWVASIIAFVMCGILLCVYSPCAYITAGLIFIVAAVFDMLQFFAW